jgi:hypothetical protein
MKKAWDFTSQAFYYSAIYHTLLKRVPQSNPLPTSDELVLTGVITGANLPLVEG